MKILHFRDFCITLGQWRKRVTNLPIKPNDELNSSLLTGFLTQSRKFSKFITRTMKCNKITFILLIFFYSACNAQSGLIRNSIESHLHNQEKETQPSPVFKNLAEAAEWADLVAIAQVDDIEYKKVRKLNSEGYGYLQVLIPYKGSAKGEPIAVLAKGFDDNVCYYPDRENEGERFLVFLKKAPNEKSNVYYGYKPFCQLQILLSETGQYILRTPLTDNVLELNPEFIQPFNFRDPHAMLDATLWTSTQREKYAELYNCKIISSEDTFNKYFHLRYTQGIPIYKIRELMKINYTPRISSDQI